MRGRYVIAGLATLAGTISIFGACSLDLDESLIDRKDGGVVLGDVVVPEGATVTESGVIENPTAAACTKDEECVSANGCLKGRCDLARRACAFDVCRPAACSAGKCDETARTCAAPATYKLRAATIPLAQPILCAGCLVAAYPWVFVGSQQGLVAYNASNPANEAPVQVPITGIGFIPTRMTRSGNRIWLAGNPAGQGLGPSRMPIAFIDVPADPFTPLLRAQTVLVEYKRPPENIRLFPRDNKTLLLVGPPPTFASALVETNIAEPATLSPSGFAPPADTDAFGISGTRLVMMTTAAGTTPTVNLVTNVGAGAVTVEKSIVLADMGEASATRMYGWASGVDGTVFWAGGANTGAPPGAVLTRAVRGYFLTPDGKSPIPDAPAGIDIEVYEPGTLGANADAVRFPVLLDNNTVMVAASSKEDPTKVAVSFIERSPLALKADKRVILPAGIGDIVASSSSNGIGYLGSNEANPSDAGPPTLGKVYVFDPACAP